MPLVSQLQLKFGLVWMILALMLGIYIYWPGGDPVNILLKPLFYHMVMFGWVTQVIMGVAFWMFPRYTKDRPRGWESLNWVTFFTLNLGLILRLIGEPMADLFQSPFAKPVILASIGFQLIAGFAFAFNTWNRIRAK